MENLRKRINVRLFNKDQVKFQVKDYKKNVSKPRFVSQKSFNKDFPAIHDNKLVLKLDKPIYVGFSILDQSKYLMCDYNYNHIKRKYNSNNNSNSNNNNNNSDNNISVNFLFTDKESLIYEIKTDNVYEDFHKDIRFQQLSERFKVLLSDQHERDW